MNHHPPCTIEYDTGTLVNRISALEASANERDLSLSTHKKKIKVLRDQLDSASKVMHPQEKVKGGFTA